MGQAHRGTRAVNAPSRLPDQGRLTGTGRRVRGAASTGGTTASPSRSRTVRDLEVSEAVGVSARVSNRSSSRSSRRCWSESWSTVHRQRASGQCAAIDRQSHPDTDDRPSRKPNSVAALGAALGAAVRSIVPFAKLHRFYMHLNFSVVIIGALFFESRGLGGLKSEGGMGRVLAELAKLYVSFNVFLYGGIYTMNAVADAAEDAAHATKRERPIASGRISSKLATAYAVGLVSLGYCTGAMWWGAPAVGLFSLFVVVNFCYSLCLRNVKRARFVSVSTTAPLRLLLGATIAQTSVPTEALVMAYLFMMGAQSTKVRAEHNLRGGVVDGFRRYTLEATTFAGTAACIAYHLTASDTPNVPFCVLVVASNLVFVVLMGHSAAAAELLYYKSGAESTKHMSAHVLQE